MYCVIQPTGVRTGMREPNPPQPHQFRISRCIITTQSLPLITGKFSTRDLSWSLFSVCCCSVCWTCCPGSLFCAGSTSKSVLGGLAYTRMVHEGGPRDKLLLWVQAPKGTLLFITACFWNCSPRRLQFLLTRQIWARYTCWWYFK